MFPVSEIQSRWFRAINTRLTEEQIIGTKVKRDKPFIDLVQTTGKPALAANGIE